MKNIGRDVFIVLREQFAGGFIEDDQAGSSRSANAFVRVIYAAGGVEIQMIAVNKNRTVRGIVWPDADFAHQIETPQNVCVLRSGLNEFPVGRWT